MRIIQKNIATLVISTLLLSLCSGLTVQAASKKVAKIKVTSSAFKNGEDIPFEYYHEDAIPGESLNTSIPLSWKPDAKVEKKIKSYAVVVVDRHPVANNWIHLAIFNIPSKTKKLAKGAIGTSSDFFTVLAKEPLKNSAFALAR